MLIVRGIMWISVLIVMLICMVKTKRNGMKKKIRALIFVVFLFILFVFMPYSTEAPIENLFITFIQKIKHRPISRNCCRYR